MGKGQKSEPSGPAPKSATASAPALKVKSSSSTTKPSLAAAQLAVRDAAPAKAVAGQNSRKGGSEMDAIFGLGKSSGAFKASTSEPVLSEELQQVAERIKRAREARIATPQAGSDKPKKTTKVEGSKDDLFGEESQKNRKKTEEGFRIFSEEELGLTKKGGDTDLCPFDCDCCY